MWGPARMQVFCPSGCSFVRGRSPNRFANQATVHPNFFPAILGLHLDKRATLVKDVSVFSSSWGAMKHEASRACSHYLFRAPPSKASAGGPALPMRVAFVERQPSGLIRSIQPRKLPCTNLARRPNQGTFERAAAGAQMQAAVWYRSANVARTPQSRRRSTNGFPEFLAA